MKNRPTGLGATRSEMTLSSAWTRPLPHLDGRTARLIYRTVSTLSLPLIRSVEGLENIDRAGDPFVLVLNHSQRLEAVVIPVRLIGERAGKRIRFVADWNFMMIPFVGLIYRKGGVLVVDSKSARPRVLNHLKRFYRQAGSVFDRARRAIEQGDPVGIFPEGTVNRDPDRLLHGSPAAARLAIATGVPVVPAGISFPSHPPGVGSRPIGDLSAMHVRIGTPMAPPPAAGRSDRALARAFHRDVLRELSTLCGKAAPSLSPTQPGASATSGKPVLSLQTQGAPPS